MEDAIAAASQPTRREILRLIAEQEATAGDIAAAFDLTRPAVSQHLRVLREAGLVQVRTAGTQRLYHADRAALAEVLQALADFWSIRLVKLKAAAERKGKKR